MATALVQIIDFLFLVVLSFRFTVLDPASSICHILLFLNTQTQLQDPKLLVCAIFQGAEHGHKTHSTCVVSTCSAALN